MNHWIAQKQSNLSNHLAWQTITCLDDGDRHENQDNLVLVDGDGTIHYLSAGEVCVDRHPDWRSGYRRLAILDGMGGHEAGQEISQRAAQALSALPVFDNPEALYAALDALHAELIADYSRRKRAPGTTLTLVEIPAYSPHGCVGWLYHMGDSRLYELSPNTVPQCLTLDHVPATKMLMGGFLSEKSWYEQVYEQNRSMITQVFGYGSSFAPLYHPETYQHATAPFILGRDNLPDALKHLGDRRTVDLCAGRAYLLASDGLWNVVNPQSLVEQWATLDLQDSASAVLQQCFELLDRHKSADIRSDNVTALLLQMLQI